MQAKGYLDYRLKYCWLKVIHCSYSRICQPNELKQEIKKKTGGPSKHLGRSWPTQAPLRIDTE